MTKIANVFEYKKELPSLRENIFDYLNNQKISIRKLSPDLGISYATLLRFLHGKGISYKTYILITNYMKEAT